MRFFHMREVPESHPLFLATGLYSSYPVFNFFPEKGVLNDGLGKFSCLDFFFSFHSFILSFLSFLFSYENISIKTKQSLILFVFILFRF